jgi:fructose-1,6-bisphosphatase/inositol monophosphatase family enzyme
VGLELFGRFTGLTRGVRRLGAGALDLCYVAAGRLDGYYEQDLSAWDVAASSLLVEEASGKSRTTRDASSTCNRACRRWWRAMAFCIKRS